MNQETKKEVKESVNSFRRGLWWFTPIGKSHNDLLRSMDVDKDSDSYKAYRRAFDRYRYTKRAETTTKILLYASIITSVAASLGLEQLRILQNISAYIGITLLIVIFAVSSYFNLRAREDFYLRRDLMMKE